jgi:predicted CXXCH cytochrome family protein
MTTWKKVLWAIAGAAFVASAAAVFLLWRGFRATSVPSHIETVVARTMRNLAIPHQARIQQNPLRATPENLEAGREDFLARCAVCHGFDGSGRTPAGQGLYPRVPDLCAEQTQNLTDGELGFIIENGVQLTGMPAWGAAHQASPDASWKLVLFIRGLGPLARQEATAQAQTGVSAHYAGSLACRKCHAEIYDRWQKTPMANVVRDPRQHPEAIISDLATNNVAHFTKDQIALVYGSLWKQRYFTKVGDDYFPLPAQWEVLNHKWSKYLVPAEGDWWASIYPPDNMQRPTGPLCDGCHSVGYDIHSKQVAEWNVGCERCHGPGSEHAAHPTRQNILNPSRLGAVASSDTCIQCHSQGQPLANPIEGKYYDWPVGYHAGARLADFWKLEERKLGGQSFYYFADGTAHKNRMQGNDFVESVMYRRGVTCSDCHDAHGTGNYAQLRKPAGELCLECHGPESANGPHTATFEAHTHHKAGSAGGDCVACHMPAIESEGVPGTFVHAHTFEFVTPAMSERYKIANPCTSCHHDKSTAWAREAMSHWPEASPWRLE